MGSRDDSGRDRNSENFAAPLSVSDGGRDSGDGAAEAHRGRQERHASTNRYFQGHFPGKPIMPGVLIIEAMAQTGGLLLLLEIPDRENKLLYFVAVDDARFRRPVVPGDQLRLEVKVISWRGRFLQAARQRDGERRTGRGSDADVQDGGSRADGGGRIERGRTERRTTDMTEAGRLADPSKHDRRPPYARSWRPARWRVGLTRWWATTSELGEGCVLHPHACVGGPCDARPRQRAAFVLHDRRRSAGFEISRASGPS